MKSRTGGWSVYFRHVDVPQEPNLFRCYYVYGMQAELLLMRLIATGLRLEEKISRFSIDRLQFFARLETHGTSRWD